MTNRFLELDRVLAGQPARNGRPRPAGGALVRSATRKKPKCTQFSEMAIDDDTFVLDVLQFFFDERLTPDKLNDNMRNVASNVAWTATEQSKAMDFVPHPPKKIPNPAWLVSEAVQIAFRASQNKCIYEAVRVVTKSRWIREYQMARDGDVMSLSFGAPLAGAPGTPTASLTTSAEGISMIAGFERFSPVPYTDAANDCRVGYGHLVHGGPCDGSEGAEPLAGVSQQKAREQLVDRIRAVEPSVNATMNIASRQHQFDAIVSFVLNVGTTVFESSQIAELLSTGRSAEVAKQLLLWINGDGKPIPELVTRRQAESTLFATGTYPGAPEMSVVKSLGIDLSEFETGPRHSSEMQATTDWCQIRHNIIRSAVEMQGEWLTAGGLMDEGAANALPLLVKFWEAGTGKSHAAAQALANLSAADHPDQAYWSAAFISWCVRNSMPNPPPPHDGGFHYHQRHMAYIAQAARNVNDATRPFWLYDINGATIVPEDGDIICLNRAGTSHSYQSVVTNWVTNNPNSVATGSSHTDIVIGHSEEGGRRWIETIGGNVGDTVGSRYYSLDATGRLVDQVRLDGTAIAGKSNVTQTVGSRSPVVFALIRLTACPDFT